KTNSQLISSGATYQNVIGWATVWDDFESLNASTGQLTIPSSGWYEVYVRLVYSAAFSGNEGHRVAAVNLNGSAVVARQLVPPPSQTSNVDPVTAEALLDLAAVYLIRPQVRQTQGSNINLFGNLVSGALDWKVTRVR